MGRYAPLNQNIYVMEDPTPVDVDMLADPTPVDVDHTALYWAP